MNFPIENFNEYLFSVLYHGTDENILSMSKEEWSEIKKAVFIVNDLMFDIYTQNNYKSNYEFNDEFYFQTEAYLKTESRKSGSQLYQYDCTYLVNNFNGAVHYAKEAFPFGELGHFTLNLYKGLEKLNYKILDCTNEQRDALTIFEKLLKMTPKPIILGFFGLPIKNLLDEDGKEIEYESSILKEFYTRSTISVRYTDNLDFNNADIKLEINEQDKAEKFSNSIYIQKKLEVKDFINQLRSNR